MHRFYLTAWVFLPDHWHLICAPVYPATISLVMKSIKTSSMILINRRRGESGELWQPRFFDRALRTVKEYNEKVEYIHLNLLRRGTPWRAPTFVKIGAPSTRLVPPSGIEFQRVFGHERRGAKAAVRLDHRPSEDALRSTPPNLIDRLPNEKPRTAKPAVSATSLAPSCRSGQACRPFHVSTLDAPDDRNTSGNAAGLVG